MAEIQTSKYYKNLLQKLGYSEQYLTHGIISMTLLQKQYDDYIRGKETNTEHFRYKVLINYIDTISTLSEEIFDVLLSIIKLDEDSTMSLSVCYYLENKKILNDIQWQRLKNLITGYGGNPKKTHLIDLDRLIDKNELSIKKMIELIKVNPGIYDAFAMHKFNDSIEIMKILQESSLKKVRNYSKNKYNQLIKERLS
ncbi:MAG: hypothetical protein KDC16_10810 [Saprospiraceae bacterium]|nr:hypothetical protein [Saprospiraceae bacterium]